VADPNQMLLAMMKNLKAKTGKTLKQWVAIVGKSGLEKHGEMVQHLKTEHGLTHGYANLVVREAREGSEPPADGDLVAAQYAGAKAGLRPIHDAIMKAVSGFGKDVGIAPRKTYTSLRRRTQFAFVQPSTKTRIDIGIKLKGTAAKGRLEDAGKWNTMVTHRVRIEKKSEVNAELKRWLKAAYDAAG